MSGERFAGVLTWSAVAGAAVGGVLWFFGMSWPFALAAAVLIVAFGAGWAGFDDAERPLFVRPAVDPRPGTRSEVSQTAWSLRGRRNEVSDSGRKRLRAYARSRLRRGGLDVDDPEDAARIAEVLTPRAVAVLGRGGRVTMSDVEYCLDRLDQLAASAVPPSKGSP